MDRCSEAKLEKSVLISAEESGIKQGQSGKE